MNLNTAVKIFNEVENTLCPYDGCDGDGITDDGLLCLCERERRAEEDGEMYFEQERGN